MKQRRALWEMVEQRDFIWEENIFPILPNAHGKNPHLTYLILYYCILTGTVTSLFWDKVLGQTSALTSYFSICCFRYSKMRPANLHRALPLLNSNLWNSFQ